MEKIKVCVTGGSGYIGSWLVKKLLKKGYTVHATLRNLDDESKVGLLKSLPNAETGLKLFQADLYNPQEFEPAIEGFHFVFHVASPLLHNPNSSQYKDIAEAAIGAVRSIAGCCIRTQTVRRLIYTASVGSSCPMKEDGTGFKDILDESCWTPLNLSYNFDDLEMVWFWIFKIKDTSGLSYNELENAKMEVVTLVCGYVVGDTLLPHVHASVDVILSQFEGNISTFTVLQQSQEYFGTVPIVHVEDVCEAHIFCMEKPSLKGRFLCAALHMTLKELASCYKEIYPEIEISNEFMEGPERGIKCDLTKLRKEGFEYKYDVKKILKDSVDSARRLGKSSGHLSSNVVKASSTQVYS